MTEPLSQVEQRLLEELLAFHAAHRTPAAAATPPPDASAPSFRQPPRRSGTVVHLLVFAALAVVGVWMIVRVTDLGSSGAARAATPAPLHYVAPGPGAPSGRRELLNLAAAAAHQPAAPASHPRYAYTKTRGWYLDSSIGGGHTTSAVVAETTQTWLAPDGSARIRRVANQDGSRYVDDFRARLHRPLRLSTNQAALARQLDLRHPRSDGPIERFVSLGDLAMQQPIPAHVGSAVLRLLARAPDLINNGTVTDRAGRPGVAISIDSAYSGLPTRYTYIFDPHTGRLLGEEETLLGNPGKLNVRSGSVIAYTTYRASGWVANTSSAPTSTS